MRQQNKITVNKKAEKSIRAGHPWVYAEEVLHTDTDTENGEIVDVFSEKNKYLGSGFYNNNSKILVRILSDNANEKFDNAFFERRIKYAIEYRKTVMSNDLSSCRIVFGDSDGLPGFIADKFGSVIVTQIMCLGIDKIKEVLFKAIMAELSEYGEKITAIYERNDVAVREKEGLTQYKGYFDLPELKTDKNGLTGIIKISENGISYSVDYINGQKTGFFLDQKFNRRAAASIAMGKTVLDCCTHTGAFAMNCAKAGAKRVTAVDISQDAIEMTKQNAEMNGLTNIDYLCCDVFELLTKLDNSKERVYDYIILDPPAFTKSRATVSSAYKGYKEINLKAMRLLPRGGYLATCSCSHFMTDELFRKMLAEAAIDAGVQLKIIESRRQACDHPILLNVPETEYLKFYIAQVV